MLCSSCGKKVSSEAVFCRYCGTDISNQKKLIQEGYAEDSQVQTPVSPVYIKPKTTPSEETIFSKILSSFYKIPGILRIILLFIGLNVVLWGAQELYYWDDTQRMKVLDVEISDMDNKIKYMENFPHTTTQSQYDSLLNKRNKEADEYNALAESSGSRWYLIPIPTGHHTTTH